LPNKEKATVISEKNNKLITTRTISSVGTIVVSPCRPRASSRNHDERSREHDGTKIPSNIAPSYRVLVTSYRVFGSRFVISPPRIVFSHCRDFILWRAYTSGWFRDHKNERIRREVARPRCETAKTLFEVDKHEARSRKHNASVRC
jgi:hypothetical protein